MDHLNASFKRKCIGTELEYVFIPKTCSISGKKLMFEYVYKQTAIWTGPGEDVFEYRWYNKDEFLIARLKGTV